MKEMKRRVISLKMSYFEEACTPTANAEDIGNK